MNHGFGIMKQPHACRKSSLMAGNEAGGFLFWIGVGIGFGWNNQTMAPTCQSHCMSTKLSSPCISTVQARLRRHSWQGTTSLGFSLLIHGLQRVRKKHYFFQYIQSPVHILFPSIINSDYPESISWILSAFPGSSLFKYIKKTLHSPWLLISKNVLPSMTLSPF